jgi:hypothetical protein
MNFRMAKYRLHFQGVASPKCLSNLGTGIAHLSIGIEVERLMLELERGSEPPSVLSMDRRATTIK